MKQRTGTKWKWLKKMLILKKKKYYGKTSKKRDDTMEQEENRDVTTKDIEKVDSQHYE